MNGKRREFLDECRALIGDGEYDAAIDQLIAFLTGGDKGLHNEAILLSSRLRRALKQERQGLATASDADTNRARIGMSALGLIDEIETRLSRKDLPVATDTVQFEAPEEAAFEKIIGVSNLKNIAWLQKGLEAARSVCRVVTPSGLGTGFLIEGGQILTNHHVISDSNLGDNSRVEFNYEEDLTHTMRDIARYPVSGATVKAHQELDYCLFEVEQTQEAPPLDAWGYLPLHTSSTPQKGEHVTIIQHPQGGIKQIAVTANQVVNVFEHRLQYTTDTLPGSSGSPVFNDDWQVIAIHHAGGNLLTNKRGDRMFANEGILIKDVVEHAGI